MRECFPQVLEIRANPNQRHVKQSYTGALPEIRCSAGASAEGTLRIMYARHEDHSVCRIILFRPTDKHWQACLSGVDVQSVVLAGFWMRFGQVLAVDSAGQVAAWMELGWRSMSGRISILNAR